MLDQKLAEFMKKGKDTVVADKNKRLEASMKDAKETLRNDRIAIGIFVVGLIISVLALIYGVIKQNECFFAGLFVGILCFGMYCVLGEAIDNDKKRLRRVIREQKEE